MPQEGADLGLRLWLASIALPLVLLAVGLPTPVVLPAVARPAIFEPDTTLQLPNVLDAAFEMDASLLATVARAEDPRAPTAVMWVVLNRAAKYHDGDIYAAVMTGESFGTLRVWEEGQPAEWRRIRLKWPHNHRQIQLEGLAYRVLLGFVDDPTGGATHFHRMGTWEPPWAPPLAQRQIFGSHYFYQDIKPVELSFLRFHETFPTPNTYTIVEG